MTDTVKNQPQKRSGKKGTRQYAKTSRDSSYRRGSGKRGRPAGRTTGKRKYSPTRSNRSQRSSSGGWLGVLGSLFRKPAPSRPRGRPPAETASAPTAMSLDRKLDLIGIIMLFVGLLTLLSIISASHNLITARWLTFLGRAFGWGAYLFPAGLIIIGLWLVLRSFQHVPNLAIERLFGVVLFFFNLLGWMHFFSFPKDAYALAASSSGGGFAGAFIFNLLYVSLGWAGMAITLSAWMIIALILVLDVSVVDLFRWIPPLVIHLQDSIQDWMDERRNHRQSMATGSTSTGKRPLPPSNWPEAGGLNNAQAGNIAISTLGINQPRPWVLPAIDQILEKGMETSYDDDVDRQRARVIEDTLRVLGAPVNVVEIHRGPTITQFGVEPDFIETRGSRTRVRVAKIASLVDDLALALSARTIRVEAPVPGKGYIGIEVPNEQIALVTLRDVVESNAFRRLRSSLRFALGQDVAGNAVAADLSAMPHLLIAGQTGSGKSVCVNSLIACLLLHNTPDDLRLIMVDPKRVELTNYNGIPHLLAPVVVETEKVVGVLHWVLREMDMRYHKFAQAGTRNIVEYNARLGSQSDGKEKKLPKLVVFIDELADLMMLAPDETQGAITRLAQLSRATGIHLVIATQRPSVEVVTGIIKANFPARIAFAVASNTDSRVILDQPGAERLLGRGDMLFQAPDAPSPIRLQGTYVSDNEILSLVTYWQSFLPNRPLTPTAAGGIPDALQSGVPLVQIPLWDDMLAQEETDPLLEEAIDLSRRQGRASVSMLQRRLRIGYTRASRLVETMQEKGVIGKDTGPMGYEILDYGQAAPPVEEQ
ncbi:MAG: DNA translocase FtsK 4TM domain-containing protein [Anaerolineales bacterium]